MTRAVGAWGKMFARIGRGVSTAGRVLATRDRAAEPDAIYVDIRSLLRRLLLQAMPLIANHAGPKADQQRLR